MEASDGSPDGKLKTNGDDILTYWKHPVAVSTKMEASGGSEYKMHCCPHFARSCFFPYVCNALSILMLAVPGPDL
jgi:hypothetical protein